MSVWPPEPPQVKLAEVPGFRNGVVPNLHVVGAQVSLPARLQDGAARSVPPDTLVEASDARLSRWLEENASEPQLRVALTADAESSALYRLLSLAAHRGLHRAHLFGEVDEPPPAWLGEFRVMQVRLSPGVRYVVLGLARATDVCAESCPFATLDERGLTVDGETWADQSVPPEASPDGKYSPLFIRAPPVGSATLLTRAAATASAHDRLLTLVFDD
ncbi:MAG: hypothetical protein AB1938_28485 [Myxococcota bacterium]